MKRSEGQTVKNRISKKLRSQTGASITFALLLFLVCAALSAVVLVAATTASGRMSGLAKADQKYYSVTSAAELIRDMIGEESVSVIRFKDGSTVTFDKPMNRISNEDVGLAADTLADEDAGSDPQVKKETGGQVAVSGFARDLAQKCSARTASTSVLYLTSDLADNDLGVEIKEETDAYGNVAVTVSSRGANPYSMLLTFSSDINNAAPAVTKSEGKEIASSYEVSWHLTRMVSAYDAE